MNKCTNCGSVITCSCQQRTASDGAKVCVNCLLSYEGRIAQEKQNNVAQGIAPAPGPFKISL